MSTAMLEEPLYTLNVVLFVNPVTFALPLYITVALYLPTSNLSIVTFPALFTILTV